MLKHFVAFVLVSTMYLYAGIEVEPNGTFEKAQVVSNHETVYATVRENSYDIDYYKFTANGHAFNFSFHTTEENINYYIYVYNQQRQEVESYTVNKGERGFDLTLGTNPGTVYIKVAASNHAGTDGAYELEVSGLGTNEIAQNYEIQPNGAFTSAQLISQGITYKAYISKNKYDIDYYKVRNINGTMHLYLKTESENIDHYIYVYNRQQRQIASYTLSKGDMVLDETLGVETDTVYIKVSASNYTDGFGAYEIGVNRQAGPTPCEVTLLSSGAGVYDYLSSECMSNVRSGSYAKMYRFSLSQSSDVTIDLDSDYIDTYLVLFDQFGNVVQSDDDGGTGTNSSIHTHLNAGSYTVEATTYYGGASGSFSLHYTNRTNVDDDNETILQEWELREDNLGSGYVNSDGKYVMRYLIRLDHLSSVAFAMFSNELDSYLVLYDQYGRQLAYDDDSAGYHNALIDVQLSAGEYILETTSYYSGITGNYTVSYYTY